MKAGRKEGRKKRIERGKDEWTKERKKLSKKCTIIN